VIRFLLALLFGLQFQFVAAEPRSNASADEIINALTPKAKTPRLGRNLLVETSKIDLLISFDFDSATVKEHSKPLLDRLAEALRSERLVNLRFQVEGHTDALGSATYNEALSTRRADAVVNYLTQAGIEKDRLLAIGKGFTELLDANDPKAAKNRRVRVLTLE